LVSCQGERWRVGIGPVHGEDRWRPSGNILLTGTFIHRTQATGKGILKTNPWSVHRSPLPVVVWKE
jgi:hypothetical protein